MPHFIGILGGVGIAYALIESGKALEALALLTVWIALLWIWPQAAVWMISIAVMLGILAAAIAMWEYVLGVALGVLLFILLVGGLLHALGELSK